MNTDTLIHDTNRESQESIAELSDAELAALVGGLRCAGTSSKVIDVATGGISHDPDF
jgi:putative ATP-grasp target RiPP